MALIGVAARAVVLTVRNRRAAARAAGLAGLLVAGAGAASGQIQYSWRYYRPGNTGIQGDYCDALWIGPDNDPWIGGYVPSFEEGGIAKFVQAENRWINISNVDYPVIGHPDNTGTTRVSEIVPDEEGNLWMGTGRGALKFNPSVGPSSLVRYDAGNSTQPGGWTESVERAPDGTLWFSAYGTAWGGGGLSRYNPGTNAWNTWAGYGGDIAVQPRPGGGYYVWADNTLTGLAARFDSTTQSWTGFPRVANNPAGVPAKACTDEAGNVWMHRLQSEYVWALNCRRPDGAWINPPLPGGPVRAMRAFGDMQAMVGDDNGGVWRFDGVSWTSLGQAGIAANDIAMDRQGNIWVCGVGGAAKRDAQTGAWQRYRITNTGQYDGFNNDLTLDAATGGVWACANAGPGVGGMVRFDGARWTGFNEATYGLGFGWPFPTDNSDAVLVRPSSGGVVVNPMFNYTHEWNGASWAALSGGRDEVVGYAEDSLGRLWQLGEYYYLSYRTAGGWAEAGITGWGQRLRADPDRPGTVWAATGHEIVRTDGAYRFSRAIGHFPALTTQSDTFSGLAPGRNGVAWVGCTVMYGAGGTGGGLIRLDAAAGTHTMLRYDQGWPLPGKYVSPLAVTPDGRVWMQYDSDYLTAQRGLCWYDGTSVGVFPAPPGGEPQWGGLPHAGIKDCEVRIIPGGYELWMACTSRGIAVLTVTAAAPVCYANCDGSTLAPILNVNDFICFQGRYAAADPRANCDGSTAAPVLNVNDFICFQSRFAAGCP